MKFLINIAFFCWSFSLSATQVILLNDTSSRIYFRGAYIEYLEDPTDHWTIKEISAPSFTLFKPSHEDVLNIHTGSKGCTWVRLAVRNESQNKHPWLLEFYDPSLSLVELYIPKDSGGYTVKRMGNNYAFDNREVPHKNFVFELPNPAPNTRFYYVKIRAEQEASIIGVLRYIPQFIGYSNSEYFLLALFYGILLCMTLYNLFFWLMMKDRTYLYYILYIIGIAIYSMCRDGMGFQFIWPTLPALNDYLKSISMFTLVVFALLYAQRFLHTREMLRVHYQIINVLVVLRIIIFIPIITSLIPPWISFITFDILCLAYAYLVGIISWWKGYLAARYYVIAFTLLFIGFMLTSLETLGLLPHNIVNVYGLNIGSVLEMFFLSLALADRVKLLAKESQQAQVQMIEQLRLNEELKDRINEELERKVRDRTAELKESNDQLETFIYRASHDIKGPLKSIIGLTTVGQKDIKDTRAHEYFDHILKSTKKLDDLLADLLQLTRVKQTEVVHEAINFEALVEEAKASFKHLPAYEHMEFSYTANEKAPFASDKKLMYSIIQNLVENPIKYRDPNKKPSRLDILVTCDAREAMLVFRDNGIGIPEHLQGRIFDMFFKADEYSNGTGLGLFIVKTTVEKLGGKISVQSKPGEGSVFTVHFKTNKE